MTVLPGSGGIRRNRRSKTQILRRARGITFRGTRHSERHRPIGASVLLSCPGCHGAYRKTGDKFASVPIDSGSHPISSSSFEEVAGLIENPEFFVQVAGEASRN